jgi:hypothetical protein
MSLLFEGVGRDLRDRGLDTDNVKPSGCSLLIGHFNGDQRHNATNDCGGSYSGKYNIKNAHTGLLQIG